MIRHALLCRHISDIRRPYFLQLVTDSSQTVWPCSVPRKAGLCRCHLLGYSFTEHTFGKSKDMRTFLLSTIVVHLVSSALHLVILVTQPLYLATRPLLTDSWSGPVQVRMRPHKRPTQSCSVEKPELQVPSSGSVAAAAAEVATTCGGLLPPS